MTPLTRSMIHLAARVRTMVISGREDAALHDHVYLQASPPLKVEDVHTGLGIWAQIGFPLVVLDEATARELAFTDPPERISDRHCVGIEFGRNFALFQPARGEPPFASRFFGPDPYERADCINLVDNVLYALSVKPEGLEIGERHPSRKVARKHGLTHVPRVEYVIRATVPLHREATSAGSAEGEGRSWSVRTMVRGHWRQQPYGPRSTLRKVIWIRPHWAGPEGAPVSVHPLSL